MNDKGEAYLLYGEQGEYSDYRMWPVGVFTSEERGELFRKVCQARSRIALAAFKEAEEKCYDSNSPYPSGDDFKYPEDPNASVSSSYAISYHVSAVPLNPALGENALELLK